MNWKLQATMMALAAGLVLAQEAKAQCGMAVGRAAAGTAGMLKPVAFPLSARMHGQVQDSLSADRDEDAAEPIVGLWEVLFAAKDSPGLPDGFEVDHGYSVWHSDNTEFLNSSRAPATQNFCLGVWKKVGRATYKLNHFALAFDGTGVQVGTVNIREEVTVDWRKNTFTGTFSIDAYDLKGVHFPSDAPGNHANGVITGERVTIYTRVD